MRASSSRARDAAVRRPRRARRRTPRGGCPARRPRARAGPRPAAAPARAASAPRRPGAARRARRRTVRCPGSPGRASARVRAAGAYAGSAASARRSCGQRLLERPGARLRLPSASGSARCHSARRISASAERVPGVGPSGCARGQPAERGAGVAGVTDPRRARRVGAPRGRAERGERGRRLPRRARVRCRARGRWCRPRSRASRGSGRA